jgi:hypothetical protein
MLAAMTCRVGCPTAVAPHRVAGRLRRGLSLAVLAILAASGASRPALGCACGCGVFDVQAGAMFPNRPGTRFWLEYDTMDQNHNQSGIHAAPAANNPDKEIGTVFVKAGVQYMVSRSWGIMGEIPYWFRDFTTTGANNVVGTFHHSALGDIQLMGMYTGFAPDMSSGLTFGLKLPTGDSTYANFDPDTEIGSGSTDLLLGGYHTGSLAKANRLSYFVNGRYDQPFLHPHSYRPGPEFDVTAGISYNNWRIGKVSVQPQLQLIGSLRGRDGGPGADPADSGYTRLLVSPGVVTRVGHYWCDADVALPLYQNVNGNQLVADYLLKFTVGREF